MGAIYDRLGTMVDCSRNAVMRPEAVKEWIDITSSLGYNCLLLYTEDTYEVISEPWFGYMRGRYSREELRELDDYARDRGMELIPCIQTLAHLNAIVRWPEYREHTDTGDILLAGDERVYELIDHIFASLADVFSSRTVNIGMDEAHMIGRGKYYDLHGDQDRFGILLSHLNRVAEIGKKYGFRLIMWSDMFFRLATGGEYYQTAEIDRSVAEKIPDNVSLVYWDYYSLDEEHYIGMLRAHESIRTGTWFAGGLWTWAGYAPHNGYSIKATKAAVSSCRKSGVSDMFFTLWGDDGGTCSRFAMLPALYAAACMAQGMTDESEVRKRFRDRFGISWDDFLLLDLPGTPNGETDKIVNAEKYLLFNDPFVGLMDSTVSEGDGRKYGSCADRLSLVKGGRWSCLFAAAEALCRVLELKTELGVRTRKAYALRHMEELEILCADYKETERRMETFFKVYREWWYSENKPEGFEVQEIRLGGLMLRLRSCRERLQGYIRGETEAIDELEQNQLALYAGHGQYPGWRQIVSVNTL